MKLVYVTHLFNFVGRREEARSMNTGKGDNPPPILLYKIYFEKCGIYMVVLLLYNL